MPILKKQPNKRNALSYFGGRVNGRQVNSSKAGRETHDFPLTFHYLSITLPLPFTYPSLPFPYYATSCSFVLTQLPNQALIGCIKISKRVCIDF